MLRRSIASLSDLGCCSPLRQHRATATTICASKAARTRALDGPSENVKRSRGTLTNDHGPSLLRFHPGIAAGWIAGTNGFTNPAAVLPSSRKLVWWRCAHCDHAWKRTVADHVASGGQCVKCRKRPSLHQRYKPLPASRCHFRRLKSARHVFAENPNRLRLSVAHLKHSHGSKVRCRSRAQAPSDARRLLAPPPIHCRNIQPMLAHSWEKYAHAIPDDEALAVSPKLDGIRCIAVLDPRVNAVVLISRHGTIIQSCLHIQRALKPLFVLDPHLVLDGELYHHTAFANFEELSGLVRRQTVPSNQKAVAGEEDSESRIRNIQFHVFDVMDSLAFGTSSRHPQSPVLARRTLLLKKLLAASQNANGTRRRCIDNFLGRTSYIKSLLKVCSKQLARVEGNKFVRVVPATQTTSEKVTSHLREYLSQGYEGAIIRRVNHPYAHGKRSCNLLKFKKFQDKEFKIVGVLEGTGKWKHCIGTFLCKTQQGRRFYASPSVSQIQRRQMWGNRSTWIGKMLTVKYQELTNGGVPRFPVAKAVRGSSNQKDWL